MAGAAASDGPSAGGQQEKQVLYRLISGMHASITACIIRNFFNDTSGEGGQGYGINGMAIFVWDTAGPLS